MTSSVHLHRGPIATSLVLALAFASFAGPAPRAYGQEEFLRGDVNVDGRLSTSDMATLQRFLFRGLALECPNAGDIDDSGDLNISDSIGILNHLFRGHAAPAAPYPEPGLDPTPNTDERFRCSSYEITPPVESDDVVEVGVIEGLPGEIVEVPIYVTSSVPVEAYQLVIEYDPELFDPLDEQEVGSPVQSFAFEGTFYEDLFGPEGPQAPTAAMLRDYHAAGFLTLAFLPDILLGEERIPPGPEIPVFKIRGRIPETAPTGASADLAPVNRESGFDLGGLHLRNELTSAGEARFVSVEPELFPGILAIVGDQIFFRGDSNSDDTVDISDASFTLEWLFASGPGPVCLDAADANDDGRIDVSDPVAVLGHLFLGFGPLPAPGDRRGRDPTPDGLGCEATSF